MPLPVSLFRALGFLAAVAALVVTLGSKLDEIRPGGHGRDRAARPLNLLAQERAASLGGPTVLLVGDSMLLPTRDTPDPSVPERLAHHLAADTASASAELSSFVLEGLGATGLYYVADELANMRWDVVVIQINPRILGEKIAAASAEPELARHLPLARILPTLALPLHRVDLTSDQLIAQPLLRRAGFEGLRRRVARRQRQVQDLHHHLAAEADRRWAGGADKAARTAIWQWRSKTMFAEQNRFTRRFTEEIYGPVLTELSSDHPSLAFLAAAIDRFAAHGSAVLAFAPPVNVDHLRSLGLYDRATFHRNLEVVADRVRESGGQWLDLHDSLPDSAFRDAGGHLTMTPPDPGAERFALDLVPFVRAGIERAEAGHP